MSPKDADGMANCVDPDQTAPLGSTLFVHAYLSEISDHYGNALALNQKYQRQTQ